MNEDYLYQVKKNLIVEEWKKRRTLMERRERLKKKKMWNKDGMMDKLASSFRKRVTVNKSYQGNSPSRRGSASGLGLTSPKKDAQSKKDTP